MLSSPPPADNRCPLLPWNRRIAFVVALVGGVGACVEAEVEDGEHDGFRSGKADGGFEQGSAEARGVLMLVNDPAETTASLKSGAGITSRVAGDLRALIRTNCPAVDSDEFRSNASAHRTCTR